MGVANRGPPSPEECEESWERSPELEGWAVSHNAIRHDMSTFAKAVTALEKTLEAEQPLAAWQVDAVKTFWSQFAANVMTHRTHEQDYFFPWLATRMPQLAKLERQGSGDDHCWHHYHRAMLQLEKEVDILMAQVGAGAPVADSKLLLHDIAYKFTLFKREMTAHMDDWETDIVPVMRRRFTQQEERKVVAAMFKQMGKFEGPATVWHLPPDERRAFMNRVGISKPVQWLVLDPKTKQYDQLFQQPVRHVIAGTPPPQQLKKGST